MYISHPEWLDWWIHKVFTGALWFHVHTFNTKRDEFKSYLIRSWLCVYERSRYIKNKGIKQLYCELHCLDNKIWSGHCFVCCCFVFYPLFSSLGVLTSFGPSHTCTQTYKWHTILCIKFINSLHLKRNAIKMRTHQSVRKWTVFRKQPNLNHTVIVTWRLYRNLSKAKIFLISMGIKLNRKFNGSGLELILCRVSDVGVCDIYIKNNTYSCL